MIVKILNVIGIIFLVLFLTQNCTGNDKALEPYFEYNEMICQDKEDYQFRCEDAFKVCWFKLNDDNRYFITCRQK
jgi:hypothetical protein